MDTRNLSGLRIAVYARYSSDNQRETSIDDQVRRCREHVERAGGTVAPELVFSDYAVSGASLQRPAFEQMMAKVTAQPKQIDAIVTEDLSRVTRDFADGAMIFKRLKYLEIPLIGVADGMDTSSSGGKLTFTVKSLLADLYLDDLRDKTLRGLEGRALAGYSTGGLPLGYRSKPAVDSASRVIGNEIVIDATAATLVRRIFDLYLAGRSLAAIAAELNADGTPPPRAHTKHRRKGWVASTIRAILHNAAYVGQWTFKRREWRKLPGTNTRRSRPRPVQDVMRQQREHLRIVEEHVWTATQERLRAVRVRYSERSDGTPKGRSAPGRATSYVFSGILMCGACGAPMVIVGGSSARYYRCGDAHKRRSCANRLSVREDVARRALLGSLHARLASPDGIAYARRRIAEGLGEAQRGLAGDVQDRRNRLARTAARIQGLVTFIADGDRSEAVVSALHDLEAQARTERTAIAELEARASKPIRLPTPDEVLASVFDLEARLAQDPLGGREELRRLFRDGQIRLEAHPDGYFVAKTELLPLVLLLGESTRPGSESSPNRAVYINGCGGRI